MKKWMTILVVTSMLPALIVTGKEDKKEKADYPLDVCVVSGAKLGSMGEPYEYEHEGRRILLCCAGCVRAIENNPEKYLKKLDEAEEKARVVETPIADYPFDVCVVSGEPLDEWGEPIDLVHENRLIRFCCPACVSDFEKDPEKYLKKLDEGTPPEPPDEGHHHGDHDHDHEHHHHH